jgi:hypothetical protein
VCAICVGENIRNYTQYFLPLVLFSLCAFLLTVFVLCVLSSYVYLLYYVFVYLIYYVFVYLLYCTCCFTLDAGLLAGSQYP